MPKITVLPHPDVCPGGAVIENAAEGVSICRVLLDHHIEIEHACELSCACTTCHVIVRQGFNSLAPATDSEEDLLDRAWGLSTTSRSGDDSTTQGRPPGALSVCIRVHHIGARMPSPTAFEKASLAANLVAR